MDTNLNTIKLPSKAQIGDSVDVIFDETKSLKGCEVHSVKFESGQVSYDLMVPIGLENNYVGLLSIPSAFVYTLQESPLNEAPKIKCPDDNEFEELAGNYVDANKFGEKDAEIASDAYYAGAIKARELIVN